MPFMRGSGSWLTVSALLVLQFVVAIHSASIPAPRCNVKFNSTLKITEIPDGRPVNGTVAKVGRSRRSSTDSGIEHSSVSGGESPINYNDYLSEGDEVAKYLALSDDEVIPRLLGNGWLLNQGDQLASRFADVIELRDNGWDTRDETFAIQADFNSRAAFGTAFRSLKISDKARPEGKHEDTKYEHSLQWHDGSQPMEPVGSQARFGFITDPEDGCFIIHDAWSTEYWVRKFSLDQQFGSISPPLSHQSDIAFLDWKRACEKHDTNIKNLKHIFISVITTDATMQVVQSIYENHVGSTMTTWSDLRTWDERITLEPNTEDFELLFSTVQVKGIVWMLLQHREQLGKKLIKKICLFKDDITGVTPGYDPIRRGPSMYFELEDAPSGSAQTSNAQVGNAQVGNAKAGNAQAGNVHSGSAQTSNAGRIRRANNPSGGPSSGSGNPKAALSPHIADLADNIRDGGLVAAYMRASEEEIAADLVKKGKLSSGATIASQFTDVSAFQSSGWEKRDATEKIRVSGLGDYMLFESALRSLGISDKAKPQGKQEYTKYDHMLPWVKDGQTMEPVGQKATFQYITAAEDGSIIMTMMFSTQAMIKQRGLYGIGLESPPLSHSSDIAFLEWKRACDVSQTDLKSLKHIFIDTIVTLATQLVIINIMGVDGNSMTSRLDAWTHTLPPWEQRLTFQHDSDEGKALLGTVQLRGIMWMLVQHREHLGHKAVRSISLFRGVHSEQDRGLHIMGPNFYIELEDVPSVA